MATWGTLKAEIRATLLKDTAGTKYGNPLMLSGLTWAQNALCPHTALVKTATFASPDYDMASAVEFPLPTDAYLPINEAGLLYYTDSGSSERQFLDFVDLAESDDRGVEQGYMLLPADTITLVKALGSGATMTLHYYAYYPAPADPADDAAVLKFPQWASAAIGFKVAAYVLTQEAIGEGNISKFDQRPDTGTPEHSATRKSQEWLEKQWQCELAAHRRQERMTHRRGINV